jgi:hypothetical protein
MRDSAAQHSFWPAALTNVARLMCELTHTTAALFSLPLQWEIVATAKDLEVTESRFLRLGVTAFFTSDACDNLWLQR